MTDAIAPFHVVALNGSLMTFGTAQAQSHLRQVLFGMQVKLIERPLVMIAMASDKFDERGHLHDPETKSLIHQQMDALVHMMNTGSS